METPVILITGAARRIGVTIAQYLHQRQYRVIVHYLNSAQEAQLLVDELNRIRADSATCLRADLNDIKQIKTLIEQAHAYWGRLDGLVNNASRFYPTDIQQCAEEAWEDLMNANCRAPFLLAQCAAPFLKKAQGSIVNITDIHASQPMREYGIYCISKAALAMATLVLAKEFAPDVRVNAVAPGAIIWPEAENSLSEIQKNKIIDRAALKRAGHPLEIAKAVTYLMFEADYVTGETIAVDGGRQLLGF